jgi:A/G-specific adenine glycosylase
LWGAPINTQQTTPFDGETIHANLTPEQVISFQAVIYRHYNEYGRELPWRKTKNPYHIFVSEVMLQQTQVERVIKKYTPFISIFPDFASLARAELKDVLSVWQGLGYNRRALALVRAARTVTSEYGGHLPAKLEDLTKLSGVGRATASSLQAFAFNKPAVFIETNIRRVFIHHFFEGKENVKDNDILPFVEATLDRSNPGMWYHALMDYGAMLKKEIPNPNIRSLHYKKQPPFKNSDRQIRGAILRILLEKSPLSYSELEEMIREPGTRIRIIIDQLKADGLVQKRKGRYSIG